jgi:hypothetical protein
MGYYLGTAQVMGQANLAIHDNDAGALYRPMNAFMSRFRKPEMADQAVLGGWSRSRMASGSSEVILSADGACTCRTSWGYEPWEAAFGGYTRPNFIVGQTLDSGGNPIAATVQGFRTSDDLYVGETGSDNNGRYSLPTIYLNDAHYLVAYRVGSPDQTGATVNTLIPQSSPT